jgi:hypothetical protein
MSCGFPSLRSTVSPTPGGVRYTLHFNFPGFHPPRAKPPFPVPDWVPACARCAAQGLPVPGSTGKKKPLCHRRHGSPPAMWNSQSFPICLYSTSPQLAVTGAAGVTQEILMVSFLLANLLRFYQLSIFTSQGPLFSATGMRLTC